MALRPSLTAAKGFTISTTLQPGGTAASQEVTKAMSFAQAVSGISKASSNKKAPPIIKCRSIPLRQPPSAEDRRKSKPEGALQDAFEKRWHSVDQVILIEYIRGRSQGEYLGAIDKVVGPQVFALGVTAQGTVSVCLNTIEAAQKLMLEGIQIAGRHLTPYPQAMKPKRVVLSRVPIRAENEDIVNFLRQFGTVHGKMRAIPIKLGENGLGKGVFSLSREVFMTLKQGYELPSSLIVDCDGVKSYVDISTEAKCYACQQTGHLIADCAKRQKEQTKVSSVCSVELSTTADKIKPVIGEKSLEGGSAMSCSQVISTEKPAGTGDSPSLPQETCSSSDEGVLRTQKSKKKRVRRKKPKNPGAMPPPPPPTEVKKASTLAGVKRPRAEEEVLSPKRRVPEIPDLGISDLSDCETMLSIGTNGMSTNELGYTSAHSGNESSVSSLSLKGTFDIVPRCSSLTREQICSLLKRLYRKQNKSYISRVIYEYTDDPENLVPQIKSLQDRARGNKNYNEAARLDRVLEKIEMAVANRALEGSSSL